MHVIFVIFLLFYGFLETLGKNQTGDFVYSGDVSYSKRLPALSEESDKPDAITLSYCAAECRQHPLCKAIEMCHLQDNIVCRLCHYTNPTFSNNINNACQHLELFPENGHTPFRYCQVRISVLELEGSTWSNPLRMVKNVESSELLEQIEMLQRRIEFLESNVTNLTNSAEALVIGQDRLEDQNIQLWGNLSSMQQKEIGFSTMLMDGDEHSDIKANQVIIFRGVIYNKGNGYDLGTGKFKAPVSGTYVFFVSILSTANKMVAVHLTVNGNKIIAFAYAAGVPDWSVGNGNMAVVFLDKNDYVWIKASYDATPGLGLKISENSFSGFLLHEEK